MANTLFVQRSDAFDKPFTSTIGGQVWNRLQQLKEEVAQELLNEGPLCQSEPDGYSDDLPAAGDSPDVDWRHRSQLEASLRDITEAQDRLLDGNYGTCLECGRQISLGRLEADPMASLCVRCQRFSETESVFPTL
jgi:RNA polymerase-binding transcription factor